MSFGLGDAFKEFKTIVYQDARKEIRNVRDGTTKEVISQQIRDKMDFHPELTNLNNTPNSRFNDEMLAQRLVAKYKDPEKIKNAIDAILQKDARFNNNDTEKFEVDHSRLTNIMSKVDELTTPTDEPTTPKEAEKSTLSSSVKRIKNKVKDFALASETPVEKRNFVAKKLNQYEEAKVAKEKQAMKKLQANIAADLVGLVNRKPVSAGKFQDNNGQSFFMKQTHGHMEDGTFIPGYAVSAELANKDNKVLELANQAVITFHEEGNEDQASEVILGRSGRSDMEGKIDDKSMLDITERLKSSSKNGLREVKDAQGNIYYEYQRADITMMDTNSIKSLKTTAESGIRRNSNLISKKPLTPIESERAFVQDKREAIKEKWAEGAMDKERGQRYLEREVTVDGEVYKVREYEPLVWNFVFSASAELSFNVKAARKDNIPNALHLFSEYQKQNDDIAGLFSEFDTTTANGKRDLAKALKQELNNEQSTLLDDQKLALEAVLVTLTGKDSKGTDYDNKHRSDSQFMLLNHLADMTGTAITVECKSGNDRTATAMSLRCALKEFEKTADHRYDPTTENEEDLKKFAELFNKYALEFGAPNVQASRGMDEQGKAVLKTRTSPAFKKHADLEKLDSTFILQ